MKSENISLIKFLAITSVVFAHIYIRDASEVAVYFYKFSYLYGSLGVGLFFVLLGQNLYATHNKKISNIYFFDIVYPWVISALAIFAYLDYRKTEFSISFLSFFIGNGSYLYFMTVFLIFFIFRDFMKVNFLLYGTFFISMLYHFFWYQFFSPIIAEHLNLLVWYPYVFLGYFYAKSGSCWKAFLFSGVNIFLLIICGFWIFLFTHNIVHHSSYNYQSILLIYFVILLFVSVSSIKLSFNSYIDRLGRNTLFVYLWHMPFAGFFSWIGNNFLPFFHYLSAFVILTIFYAAIYFLSKLNFHPLFFKLLGLKVVK